MTIPHTATSRAARQQRPSVPSVAAYSPFPRLVLVLVLVFTLSLSLSSLLPTAAAHSQLSWPQSTAPMTCRMGGESRSGVSNCAGPCDLRAIRGGYAPHGSARNPAAYYKRGQYTKIKYQRNNHGPGGFNRLTLVPVSKMMDKSAHAQNAFFFSCWGAKPVRASGRDTYADKYGYSIVGNDGDEHGHGKAFYETTVRIPQCVPDGDYILGWVWFGGIGSPVEGNHPTRPKPYGFFADYWSCSFVRVSGGGAVKERCPVVFKNDMSQYSSKGCMAANDRPGVCVWEPCKRHGHYQKPAPFKNGRQPSVYSWMYGAGGGGKRRYPRKQAPKPKKKKKNGRWVSPTARNSCECLAQGKSCSKWVARKTLGKCRAFVGRWRQWSTCRRECCDYCRVRDVRKREGACWRRGVREVCGWQW